MIFGKGRICSRLSSTDAPLSSSNCIVVKERLDRMKALLVGPRPSTLEALIIAYVTPGLTACFDSDELRKHFGRLHARFSHEGDPAMRAIMRRHFREPGRCFMSGNRKILPHLSEREIEWCFYFMVGSLTYLMPRPGRVQAVDDGSGTDFTIQMKWIRRCFSSSQCWRRSFALH